MIYARTFRKVLISSTFLLAGCFPVAAASEQNESLDCGGKTFFILEGNTCPVLTIYSVHHWKPQHRRIKFSESGGFRVRLSAWFVKSNSMFAGDNGIKRCERQRMKF